MEEDVSGVRRGYVVGIRGQARGELRFEHLRREDSTGISHMAWSRSLRLFASVCLCLGVVVECHLRPDGRGVCSRNTTTIMSYLSTGTLTSRIMYRITRITDYQCCVGWFESGDECPIFGCMNECLNGGSCISNNTCACMPGYTGGACENGEPSDGINGNCSHTCVNTEGGWSCQCPEGFVLNKDGLTCTDVNECSPNPCQRTCTNTEGSFQCTCDPGYKLAPDGLACIDVDECGVSNGNCSDVCINTYGSYKCSCKPGFQLASNGLRCQDVNECAVNNGNCEQNCRNVDGGFECSCNPGYLLMNNRLTCMACGGSVSALEGSIVSPGYPFMGFDVSMPCVWNITAPATYNRINLTCLYVRFDDGGTCNLAYMNVTSVPSYTRTWCRTPGGSLLGNATVFVEYFSSGTGPNTGFHCHYAAAYKLTSALSTTTGVFGFPNSSGELYPNNANRTHIIYASGSNRICLQFTAMSLENSAGCSKDYVAVYDGALVTAPILGKFCGGSIPAKIASSGTRLTVVFISDSETQDAGYNASYAMKSPSGFTC
ncbi:unnamed protein product [Lampetra planeri]